MHEPNLSSSIFLQKKTHVQFYNLHDIIIWNSVDVQKDYNQLFRWSDYRNLKNQNAESRY